MGNRSSLFSLSIRSMSHVLLIIFHCSLFDFLMQILIFVSYRTTKFGTFLLTVPHRPKELHSMQQHMQGSRSIEIQMHKINHKNRLNSTKITFVLTQTFVAILLDFLHQILKVKKIIRCWLLQMSSNYDCWIDKGSLYIRARSPYDCKQSTRPTTNSLTVCPFVLRFGTLPSIQPHRTYLHYRLCTDVVKHKKQSSQRVSTALTCWLFNLSPVRRPSKKRVEEWRRKHTDDRLIWDSFTVGSRWTWFCLMVTRVEIRQIGRWRKRLVHLVIL